MYLEKIQRASEKQRFPSVVYFSDAPNGQSRARLEPGRSWEPGTLSRSHHMGGQGPNTLGHIPLLFPIHYQRGGIRVKQLRHESVPTRGANNAGGNFIC